MEIKKIYGIKYKNSVKTDFGYIFKEKNRNLHLIPIRDSEWEFLSAVSIIEYLRSRGFKNIKRIIRCRNGSIFIKNEDKTYVLIEEFEGERLRLSVKANGLKLAQLMAYFHTAGEGYTPGAGSKINIKWGKKIEKYRHLLSNAKKYKKFLEGKNEFTEFEEFTKEYIDHLIDRGSKAMEVFKSRDYLKRLEESMINKEICINDISGNTAKDTGNRLLIDKILDLGYNMIEEDIGELIKISIEESRDKAMYNNIIRAYTSVRPLADVSERIIWAYVIFPFNSLRMITRYMKNMNSSDCVVKFKKYISKEKISDF